MLQHNGSSGRQAHFAHATMVGLHAVCCGAPALAMLAAAASGAASVGYAFVYINEIHGFLHTHEIWVLAVSAALVLVGGALEASARRRRALGFPWMFAFSVFCFAANLTVMLAHRGLFNVWA